MLLQHQRLLLELPLFIELELLLAMLLEFLLGCIVHLNDRVTYQPLFKLLDNFLELLLLVDLLI